MYLQFKLKIKYSRDLTTNQYLFISLRNKSQNEKQKVKEFAFCAVLLWWLSSYVIPGTTKMLRTAESILDRNYHENIFATLVRV